MTGSQRDDAVDRDCSQGQFSPGHPDAPPPGHTHRAHPHSHAAPSVTATGMHRRRMVIVLVITVLVAAVQIVGGFLSGSLSLLADAAHLVTDAAGVGIALVASYLAGLPATSRRTFGFLRAEVLAALVNGLILCVVAVVVLVEALRRIGEPVDVEPGIMLIAAVIGAVANLFSLIILRAGQRESLNVRGAYLEVFGDLVGSIAVIIAGVVIWATDWAWADQVASILIAVLIVPRALGLLRDVVEVLLESSPRGLDTDLVRDHLQAIPGVVEVHDLHAWTITSGVIALSAHVTADDEIWSKRGYHAILDELNECLREHFRVDHATLQLEPEGHRQWGTHRHP